MLATLTSKGQVTLPAPIRAALKLDAGARLDFALQDDGSIRVVPVSRDPLAVSTVLPKPLRGPVSNEDLRAAIAARHAAAGCNGTASLDKAMRQLPGVIAV